MVESSRFATSKRSHPLRRMGLALGASVALVGAMIAGGAPANALTGDLRVHDPSVIKVGSCYYAYSTGLGGGPGNGSIQIRRSCDSNGRTGWTFVGTMFNSVPAWITQKLGQTPPSLWAPDINYVNGKYYLYYAGSIWGERTAVTGLATSSSPSGPWTDQGQVTDQNYPLDPNLAYSGSTPYLFTGSYIGGVYVQQVTASTGKVTGGRTYIAKNIENSSIVYNGGYYYLFGSKGKCCAGTASTYYTIVARSTSLTGPYTDKGGVVMTSGGGSTVLSGAGSGGGDVFQDGTSFKFAYHYYDPNNNGQERLDIRPITFSGGWPVMGNPIGP